jgi:hypothetical protein
LLNSSNLDLFSIVVEALPYALVDADRDVGWSGPQLVDQLSHGCEISTTSRALFLDHNAEFV